MKIELDQPTVHDFIVHLQTFNPNARLIVHGCDRVSIIDNEFALSGIKKLDEKLDSLGPSVSIVGV